MWSITTERHKLVGLRWPRSTARRRTGHDRLIPDASLCWVAPRPDGAGTAVGPDGRAVWHGCRVEADDGGVLLSDAQRRLAAQEMVNALQAEALTLPPAPPDLPLPCASAQEALSTAAVAARNALDAALLLNRVDKISRGVDTRGGWREPAQDVLRSSLLFACAGLDQGLKRLVQDALAPLVECDATVAARFEAWATRAITHRDSGGVDPAQLVELLLGQGRTPHEILVNRWVQSLTQTSAQSVPRVYEIADALGATSSDVVARLPKRRDQVKLKDPFEARNQIIHELDLTMPRDGTRARLERKRRQRRWDDVVAWSDEALQVAQAIITDVAGRLR